MLTAKQQTSPARGLPGRNDACFCGSGKKFKHCCLLGTGQSVPARPNTLQPSGWLSQGSPASDRITSDAHYTIGTAAARKGSWNEAATHLAEAIRLRPEFPEAINTLGVVLANTGAHERAAVCYRKAFALNPRYAAAYSNLGSSLSALGRPDEAVESLTQAIAFDPTLADAQVNLADALCALNRFAEAIESCNTALRLRPGDFESLLNLGNAHKQRGEYTLAAQAYRNAVGSNPNDPRAYTNLAETLRDMGLPDEAAEVYGKALAIQPGYATAYSNLLYLHAFTRNVSPEAELARARGWEQATLSEAERDKARTAAHPRAGVFPAIPSAGRKLRLGIVSAELGSHAVAEFLQPLLENLDRERFHLTLFPTINRWDARAQQLRSLADSFVSLGSFNDSDAVATIRREHIDVLMDTSGHTVGNRLGIFARRAAPVQCTYIGYWSTTGLTEMDWFLTDKHAPPTVQSGFSEGLWRLPRLSLAYRGDHSLACDAWQPDPSGTVWVGSFNKYGKIREETCKLWAGVLHLIPEAKLLLEDRGTHEQESHQRILSSLALHGVGADRVEFIPYVPGHERHMLLYNRLDIALDTVPFNSVTTAFDALWMGAPLVALDGDSMGGSMAAAALRSLSREEWIAQSHDEYATIVRDLARNVALRKQLRAMQRTQMAASELLDAKGLANAVQDSFVGMYDAWLAKR